MGLVLCLLLDPNLLVARLSDPDIGVRDEAAQRARTWVRLPLPPSVATARESG